MKLRLRSAMFLTSLLVLATHVQAKSKFDISILNQTGYKLTIWDAASFNIFFAGVTRDHKKITIIPEGSNGVVEFNIGYCDNIILPCSSYKRGCAVSFQNFVENKPESVKATIYPLSEKVECRMSDYKTVLVLPKSTY